MRAFLTCMVGVLALSCTDAPPAQSNGLSVARFALAAGLFGADTLEISVHTPEGEVSSHRFESPWETDPRVPIPAGAERRLELSARIANLPLAEGSSALFTAPETGVIDVEIVIDLFGLLEVVPLGLPIEAVLSVSARPLTLFDGQPASYTLINTDGTFSLALPVGRYALDFELGAAFVDWLPAVTAEVNVVAGTRQMWTEPLIDPIVEPPLPGVAETVEMLVEGGGLLGGLTPAASDITVRLLDGEGRVASGYRGEITFSVVDGLDLLGLARIPDPYRFTEADGGEHRFDDGLLPLASLLTGTVQLVVSDDTGLRRQIELSVSR